jgi:hypothetical protein
MVLFIFKQERKELFLSDICIYSEGAKQCIHILRKEKNCIKIVILNIYR